MTGRNGSFFFSAIVIPFGFVVGANILLFAMFVLVVHVIGADVLNMSFQLLMGSRGLLIFAEVSIFALLFCCLQRRYARLVCSY